MIIELLTLGDELLDGRRIDTNTAWLGRRLTGLGSPPRFRQSTTDRIEDIVAAFKLAVSRADIVISTGGLGPTADDVTFEALAKALGRDLEFHSKIYEQIIKKFEAKGLRCPEANRRQALLPKGAVEIENDWGTAPACRVEEGKKVLFCLPGVPIEMQNLFDRGVLPELEKRLLISGKRTERTYKFVGIGESYVEEAIDRCRLQESIEGEVRIAYTASFPQVDVTLSVSAKTEEKVAALLKKADAAVRKELGEHLVAMNNETLEERVVHELQKKKWTLAVAESMTGGEIAATLTDVPGSSAVFDRGFVTYSNRSKSELLGVSTETLSKEGAVSSMCALEMARGAKSRSGTDVGLATTGIAGPTGGAEEKPVGLTYLAWVGPNQYEDVRRYQFRFDRNRNRMMAVYESLKGLIRLVERKPN